MSTVQLAIRDQRYAAALSDLLQKDGSHQVAFVDRPDLGVDGIIVVDGSRPENLLLFEAQPERFVVITRKDAGLLSSVWDAGVRHVVFEGDPPSTALLAVVAAELRTPHSHMNRSTSIAPAAGHYRRQLVPQFPVPILDTGITECRSCFLNRRKPML